MSLVITVDSVIVGRINISDIVRGLFESAHLGYWVSQDGNGRGVATAVTLALEQYGLHRRQAGRVAAQSRVAAGVQRFLVRRRGA